MVSRHSQGVDCADFNHDGGARQLPHVADSYLTNSEMIHTSQGIGFANMSHKVGAAARQCLQRVRHIAACQRNGPLAVQPQRHLQCT